ncbi:hypothetical protein KJA15_02995 [Patescibacteria group bacterium]|nr:hypothetical protein [Patescibacteria group bacterium]
MIFFLQYGKIRLQRKKEGNKTKGKKISRKELEEQGWEYVFVYGEDLWVFKKGNKRIMWNFKTQIVEQEVSLAISPAEK